MNIPKIAVKDEKKVFELGFSGYVRKPAGLIDILNLYKLSNIYINNTIGDIVLFGTIVDLSKLWKDLFKWFERDIYN